MKLLFVTSNLPGALFIRWGLGTDCSHFAVCFDEEAEGSGIVFHSILGGATLEWFGEFKKNHTIMHALEFKTPLTLQDEEDIYQSMLANYSGQGYDVRAFLFWVWRGVLNKFFNVPIPNKNAWAVDGYNLCTAMSQGIKWIKQYAEEKKIDLEMISPHALHQVLLDSGYFVDSPEWVVQINT